jgi:hypothetical protein
MTVTILNDIETQIERFIAVTTCHLDLSSASPPGSLCGPSTCDQPAVWGLFAGVMNIVPYFGPLVVTAVLSAVGLLQFGDIPGALLVGGVALTITSIEGMVLTPHLLSKAGSLNHVAIFTAIRVLELGVGRGGHAARGADVDGLQGRLRSRRRATGRRGSPRHERRS